MTWCMMVRSNVLVYWQCARVVIVIVWMVVVIVCTHLIVFSVTIIITVVRVHALQYL